MARAPLNPPGPDKEKAWKVRHQGVICMLAKEVGPSGRLSHELIQRVKFKFSYRNDKSIRTLWKKYKQPILANEGFEIKRSGTSGRHLKYSADDLQNKIRNVPLKQRKTLRSLSHAAGIKHVTLYNYLRRGLIKRSTSSIKPTLTPANIQRRKDHCLSKVGADEHFSNLMEEVHVDEKWFFVDQIDEKFYLLPDEDTPYRSCKHKRHIEKVMFGAAVARPRQNSETGEWWDGKVHLHPFTKIEVAQRNSRNRPAGTLITKSVSVDRNAYRRWICDYVIHAIVAQWPDWEPKKVRLQQDNAKPHIFPWDPYLAQIREFYARPENGGWDISLEFQPPNSPDFNICDLAEFRAMQSLQQQHRTKNVDELIEVVKKCWNDFPLATSKKAWTTLQLIFDECLKVDGANNYKLPHMQKEKWIREHGGAGIPLRLRCTALYGGTAVPLSPQANTATNNDSPATVMADVSAPTDDQELTEALHNLSIEAIAEADIDWDLPTEDLEWEDDAGHEEEDGVGDEDMDDSDLDEAEA